MPEAIFNVADELEIGEEEMVMFLLNLTNVCPEAATGGVM